MGTPIQIDNITAYHMRIPLRKPFRISVGEITEKEFVIFEGRSGDLSGWGEASVDGVPFYTWETADTAWHVGRRILAPLAQSRAWSHPDELTAAMEVHRGHSFTKTAFDALLWDLYGQQMGKPVAELLGEGKPEIKRWVEGGPSIGIKDSPALLVQAVNEQLVLGYRRIKIKVRPGEDTAYIEAVRNAHPNITLMVDANAAYTPDDMDHLAEWDAFDLLMIEQPFDQNDLYYHAQLCERMRTPICLDETVETLHLTDCAIQMKAMDVLNIKVGRVGGLVNTRRIHDLCEAAGIPVWIGSRPGSGVGDAARFAAAALPNARFPTDAGFSQDYLTADVLEAPFEKRNGCEYKVPWEPGLGLHVDRKLLTQYATKIATF